MNTFLFSLVGLLIVNVVYATNIGSHNTALEPTVNDASGTLVCCQSKCFIIEEFIQKVAASELLLLFIYR